MPTLSDILNSKIGKHGKSKASVANHLGVSERTIENYMKGTRQPKPDALIKLGEFLGFSLSELSEHYENNFEQNVPYRNGSTKNYAVNEIISTVAEPPTPDYRDRYIALLEQENKRLQEQYDNIISHLDNIADEITNQIHSNLQKLESNQLDIMAQIRAASRVAAERSAGKDAVKLEQELDKYDRYFSEFLKDDEHNSISFDKGHKVSKQA